MTMPAAAVARAGSKMMGSVCLTAAALLSGAAIADVVYRDQDPQIVVETRNCSGATGLAAFHPDRLRSIKTAPCSNPDAAGEPLKQVFLKSEGGTGQYEIVWVDEAGAQSIRRQLEENRAAALERATGKRTLIVR